MPSPLHPILRALPLLLLLAPSAAAQGGAPAWPESTRESRPWTRWWWLGSAVDSAGLRSELRALHDAGFGGVEVTAIYGARGAEAAFVPYLSDRWLRLLGYTAEEAKRLGMGLDVPPGSGWRMGGPDVPPADGSATLHVEVDTVAGGRLWRMDPAPGRVEAVVAYAADGRTVEIARRPGGAVEWRAPAGRWAVYRAGTRLNGEKVKRPGPGGEGLAIDVFSAAATKRYLDDHARRTSALAPGTVHAFFHDSYEYTGDASPEVFDAFRRRRGYDLALHLPALLGQGDPEVVARVKSDYRETLSDMLLENLLRPFTAWAHAQGGVSRNQAHGSPGNLLDLYAASDIPETEIFGPMGGPGAHLLLEKFASSAAHVAGHPLASAESFTWLGEHFNVTLDEVKRAADQLFLAGINHLIYHGTAYSPESAAWPGWQFYASTEFNPRDALWRDLPAFNAYVQRVQSVLQQGRPDEGVLLYWPVYDSWHDPDGLRVDFAIRPPDWVEDRPFGAVARSMRDAGYGFDFVSDRQLASDVEASGDSLMAGPVGYRAVLVPPTDHMPLETFQRLVRLASEGATIGFVGRLPGDVPGLERWRERRDALRAAEAELRFQPAQAPGVRVATVGRGRVLLGPDAGSVLAAAGVAREPMVDHAGVHFLRRSRPDGHDYFISHSGEERLDGWVPLSVAASAVSILDPLTGRAGLARVRRGADGASEVYLQLEPGASLLLRTSTAPVTGPAWSYARPAGPPVTLRGGWSVEFVEGGPTLPAAFRADSPVAWTGRGDAAADAFSGTARYTLRFDAPDAAPDHLLDLGRVAESARIRLNGRDLGTVFARPFLLRTGPLKPAGNVLEVEVTNLSANRIRDLDVRGVPWRIFHDINFVNLDYQPFDASTWPVRPSGLLGPVHLQPLAEP